MADKQEHSCLLCGKESTGSLWLKKHILLQHMPNIDTSFKCWKCDLTFQRQLNLRIHLKTHSAGNFKCHVCKKQLPSKIALKVHSKIHDGDRKLISCSKCNMRLLKISLKKHMLQHSSRKKVKCPKCSAAVYDIKQHNRVAHQEALVKCKICWSSFLSFHTMLRHMEQIHNSRNKRIILSCLKCGKKYQSYSSLAYHLEAHKAIRKLHKCALCPKIYQSKRGLVLHTQTMHSQNRMTYTCKICKAIFVSRPGFEHHKMIHMGRKKKKCPKCSVELYRIKEHLRFTHGEEKTYTCSDCSAIFNRKCSMDKHVRNVHSTDIFQCPKCTKSFTAKIYLAKHVLRHDKVLKKCAECDGEFYDLEQHTQRKHGTRGNQLFSCSTCSNVYRNLGSMKRHVRKVHTEELPYV